MGETGIELPRGNMPEQPADPLHYEMKIPPEKHSSKDKEDADNSNHPDREEKPDVVKDNTDAARGVGEAQTRRSSE
jgi:hypothetical protein